MSPELPPPPVAMFRVLFCFLKTAHLASAILFAPFSGVEGEVSTS